MIDPQTTIYGLITWGSALLGAAVFLVTLSASLAIVSFVLVRLPADYFQTDHEGGFLSDRPAAVRWAGVIGKNLLGVLLVILGVILSIPGVPGQGILTILLGIMLLDFPGRRRLEQKLISRPSILRSVNKLRDKFGKPALVLD